MSRKSRDQRGQFKTMVRYDGRGRIIPGGNILKKGKKPQEGRWEAKEAYECCNASDLSYKVGDSLFDGIVADVLPNNQYLLVALSDLTSVDPNTFFWDPDSPAQSIPGSTGVIIGTGKSNTDAIINAGIDSGSAANQIRSQFGASWNLPSQNEFLKICENKLTLENNIDFSPLTTTRDYWTSTQDVQQTGSAVKITFNPFNANTPPFCDFMFAVPKANMFKVRPMKIVTGPGTGALIDPRIILPYAWDHSTPGPDEIWTFDTVGRNDEWAGTLTERQELNGGYIEIGSSLYKLTPDEGSFIVTLANSINSQVISTDATEFQYSLNVEDGLMNIDDGENLVTLERIVL